MNNRLKKLAFGAISAVVLLLLLGLVVGLKSVGHDIPPEFAALGRLPRIIPDYAGIVIPPNIAPLNFLVDEPAVEYRLRIHGEKGADLLLGSLQPSIIIPQKAWRELLSANRGGRISLDLYAKDKNGRWSRFDSIENEIAPEEIDAHLVYRLIGPLCNMYNNVGIYQRNLENYDETPVLTNQSFDGCLNCHSFLNNRPDQFAFQVRPGTKNVLESGTIIVRDGHAMRIKTKSKAAPKQSSNTIWHPQGSLIAFSMTMTRQFFHGAGAETREAYDFDSHLAIVNTKTGVVSTSPDIADADYLENFPCWSPNGKTLYYCHCKKLWDKDRPPTIEGFNKLKYDLMRISYNEEQDSFGRPEVILAAAELGKSISEPKASPDGRFLLFCVMDYGTFPLFQSNSDLYILEVADGKYRRLECNSDSSEAWHCWSSNSRWIVFSSKRDTRLMARPYFSYIDKNGKAHKPFILPQKNPAFYDTCLKTFNVPELITGPITVSKDELLQAVFAKNAQTDEPAKTPPTEKGYMGAN